MGGTIGSERRRTMLSREASSFASRRGTDSATAKATTPAPPRSSAERIDSARSSALPGMPPSCRMAASARLRHAPSAPATHARLMPIA
eukprot:scaffold99817_cov62-Phaeocystis_antarctica.AAC.1